METRRMEHLAALGLSEAEQQEMRAIVEQMLGKYGEVTTEYPREVRGSLKAKLAGISVSRMIVEAR